MTMQMSKLEAEKDGPMRLQLFLALLKASFEARLAYVNTLCTPSCLHSLMPAFENAIAGACTAIQVCNSASACMHAGVPLIHT